MDLLSAGLNIGIIVGIIAITQVIKKVDAKKKLKKYYVVFPLILGIAASFFMTNPLEWQGIGLNAMIYAGVSSYLYNSGMKFFGTEKKDKGGQG